jgi:hypothetical protein
VRAEKILDKNKIPGKLYFYPEKGTMIDKISGIDRAPSIKEYVMQDTRDKFG